MILVDTNVFSALMRIDKEPTVQAWMDRLDAADLRVSAPTIFEIELGIAGLPPGRRRRELEAQFAGVAASVFANKVLFLDADTAIGAARIHAAQQAKGRNVAIPDSLIAGIAFGHGASIATRNMRDFSGLGIPLVNPWET